MQQEGTDNLVLLYFSWWYSYLPSRLYLAFIAVSLSLVDLFSVKSAVTTLFAPWRRDVIDTSELSLPERFQAFVLNLSSRFIGAIIKLSVIVGFLVSYAVTLVLFFIASAIWVTFPFVVVGLFILGFLNLLSS